MSEFESHEVEIEVDLAAFLPEGTGFDADDVEVEADEPPVAHPVGDDPAAEGEGDPALDLDALAQIERDLDAVDAAIAALDAGTYGIDPATGAPIDDAVLAADPTRLS